MELKKLQNLAISDSGFIFDPASGHSYTANETALFIINKLKSGFGTDDVIKSLTDTFDIDTDTAENDTVGIVEQLTSNYLI